MANKRNATLYGSVIMEDEIRAVFDRKLLTVRNARAGERVIVRPAWLDSALTAVKAKDLVMLLWKLGLDSSLPDLTDEQVQTVIDKLTP